MAEWTCPHCKAADIGGRCSACERAYQAGVGAEKERCAAIAMRLYDDDRTEGRSALMVAQQIAVEIRGPGT